LAQVSLFLAVFFALWILRATYLIRIDQSIQSSESRAAFSMLAKIMLWAFPAALFGYWARRTNPIEYLGLSAIPSSKKWTICLITISLWCLVIFSFELAAGHKTVSIGTGIESGIVSRFAIFILTPLIEEIFFRGLVLKEISVFIRFAFSNIVTSLLFVGIHLPYWISSGIQPHEIARTSLGVFLFSLFAGWLYFFSKSIWPPTAAHMANNILAFFIHPG
jgi:membrane protease YdiL (CAAX protease family)